MIRMEMRRMTIMADDVCWDGDDENDDVRSDLSSHVHRGAVGTCCPDDE